MALLRAAAAAALLRTAAAGPTLGMVWMGEGLGGTGWEFGAASVDAAGLTVGKGTKVGPFHASPAWTASAADPASRTFWLADGDNGGPEDGPGVAGQYLHTVTFAADGTYKLAPAMNVTGATGTVFALHWDAAGKRLVGVANAFDAVVPVAIDPATGAAAQLGPPTDPLGPALDWGVSAHDAAGGAVWVAMNTAHDPAALLRADLSGGASSVLQCPMVTGVAAVAFDAAAGGLWVAGIVGGDAVVAAVDATTCAVRSKVVLAKKESSGAYKRGNMGYDAAAHAMYLYGPGGIYKVDLMAQTAEKLKIKGSFNEVALACIQVVAIDGAPVEPAAAPEMRPRPAQPPQQPAQPAQDAGPVSAVPDEEWAAFKVAQRRRYATMAEEAARRAVFARNMAAARRIADGADYGAGPYADLTEAEFASRHNAGEYFARSAAAREAMPAAAPAGAAAVLRAEAASVDWRQKGAVTAVKDQGKCGSCWAFSVTGNVEGQTFLTGGNLTALSEQQLVECDKDYGDSGCQGGWPPHAYRYIHATGGLVGESAYPYTSHDGNGGGACTFAAAAVAARVSGWQRLPGDEGQMLAWMGANGPVSVGVNAGLGWQLYRGGVMKTCAAKDPDHGVLIVGYGTDESAGPYWVVKNSWGAKWGEDGYIRLAYGKNACNIVNLPTSAKV